MNRVGIAALLGAIIAGCSAPDSQVEIHEDAPVNEAVGTIERTATKNAS